MLQLVVAAEPKNASYYAALAEYAYKAKNARVGDLASTKAVSLAPATDRARVKTELEAVKKYPNGGQTYMTTTNGKTYALKKGRQRGIPGHGNQKADDLDRADKDVHHLDDQEIAEPQGALSQAAS